LAIAQIASSAAHAADTFNTNPIANVMNAPKLLMILSPFELFLRAMNEPSSTSDARMKQLLFPFAYRSISNYRVAIDRRRLPMIVNVSRDRHAEPIEERIHVSALYRAFCVPELGYAARNLVGIFRVLANGFGKEVAEIAIVGGDGELLSPHSVDGILLAPHLDFREGKTA
jgi:hypothetical protein